MRRLDVSADPIVQAIDAHAFISECPRMTMKICDVNAGAIEKLPARTNDKSGIGVHYVDAYLKPMNTELEDGTPVKTGGAACASR